MESVLAFMIFISSYSSESTKLILEKSLGSLLDIFSAALRKLFTLGKVAGS